jgi:hypothetical protein
VSTETRSAPLARRLQAAKPEPKAEPMKPEAPAASPTPKLMAKPEPTKPPSPKPKPTPGPVPEAASKPPRPAPAPPAQPPASEPGQTPHPFGGPAPALDPRAVLVRGFDWKRLPATPLRVTDVPPGVVCRLGTLAYSHAPYDGRPTLALRTRRGTFPWRYDWPVDDTIVSCQVVMTPEGPTAVWLRLRPDRLRASRRMHEIYQVVYRVWERGRVEIGEYLAALIEAES